TVVETGIEVMYLVTKIGGRRPHKEVDSDEGEYSLTVLPIAGDVLARHEAHFRIKNKRRVGRRSDAAAGPASEDVGGSQDPVKIRDGRKLRSRAGQVHMENMAVAQKIESARNRAGQCAPQRR